MGTTGEMRALGSSARSIVGVLGFLVLLPAFSTAASATNEVSLPLGASSVQWAYGATWTGSGSVQNSTSELQVHATFGWQVILTQSASLGGNYSIQINRTVGSSVSIVYCRPSCTVPALRLNASDKVVEQMGAFANLTSSGAVEEAGGSARALALSNEHVTFSEVKHQSGNLVVTGLLGTRTYSRGLDARLTGDVSVGFVPALGLVPLSPRVGEIWTSTSNLTAVGSWSGQYSFSTTAANGTATSASGRVGGNVGTHTTVHLMGQDVGHVTLDGGTTVPALGIAIDGTFSLLEGVLVLPVGADLLGDRTAAWHSGESVSPSAAPHTVELSSTIEAGHVGLLASAVLFSSGGDASASLTTLGQVPSGPTPASSGATSPTVVQAQPESVPTAQSSSNCLAASSAGCAGASSVGGGFSLPAAFVGAIVGLALVGLLVGLVVTARKRPVRPPASPAARAYGPGERLPPAPVSTPRSRASGVEAPSEPDPLGHLW